MYYPRQWYLDHSELGDFPLPPPQKRNKQFFYTVNVGKETNWNYRPIILLILHS